MFNQQNVNNKMDLGGIFNFDAADNNFHPVNNEVS